MTSTRTPDAFLELASDWYFSYRYQFFKFLALKEDSGNKVKSCMIGFLAEEPSNTPRDIIIETDSILAGSVIRPISGSDLLEEVVGIVKNPSKIRINDELTIEMESERGYDFYYEPKYPSRLVGARRIPSISISSGSSKYRNIDGRIVDLELNACEVPFRGLSELLSVLQITDNPDDPMRHPSVEILLDIPIMFVVEDCTLEAGQLNLRVRTRNGIEIERLDVGVIAYVEGSSEGRFSIGSSEWFWKDCGEYLEGTVTQTVDNCAFAFLFLRYGRQSCMELSLNDKGRTLNERSTLHKFFDPKNSILGSLLDGDYKKFDEYLQIVLQLVGLSVIRYSGFPKLDDNADLVAFSEGGIIYLIESTTGSIDNKGKLLKLHKRHKDISVFLNSEKVFPIMITNLERMHTRSHWSAASNFGISLICREELEDIVNLVSLPIDLQGFHSRVVGLVPQASD